MIKPREYVEWDSSGVTTRGRTINVSDGNVLIRVFARTEDGDWEPTNRAATVPEVNVRQIEKFEKREISRQPARKVRKGSVEHRVVKFSLMETRDATETLPAQAWVRVNDYSLTDTYGTRFAMGGCKAYLNAHPNRPTLLYGHGTQGGITSALGHAVAWRENAQGLEICFEFDNFEDVPAARQAFSQLRSGTFDSFSVGFIRHSDHYDEANDCTVIDSYDLPETSIVIEASNAGTGILQLSGARMTKEARATQVLINLDSGALDLSSAIAEMRGIIAETRDPADGDGDDADMVTCSTCKGTGKIKGGSTKCPDCNGTGEVDPDAIGDRGATLEAEMAGNDAWDALSAEERAGYIEWRSKYSTEQLAQMLKDGQAMANANGEPSYPIMDEDDLHKAIGMVGLGNKNGDAIRKYIIGRAKALGMESKIPDTWNADGSIQARGVELDPETRGMLEFLDIA